MSVYDIYFHPLPAPISLFLQLLSAYCASVVSRVAANNAKWVCLYFSSFLFAAIILLLEVPPYFISWNIQVSIIFFYITSMVCWSTEHFPCLELNCRNTSVSLEKQEMPWKQEVASDCFNKFSVHSQTCTSYRNKAFSLCCSFSISWVSFLHDYIVYSHFGGHHLSVSQVSVKRNIWQ